MDNLNQLYALHSLAAYFQLICDRCQKTSLTFDPFMYLSLPIPTTTERLVEVVFFPAEGNPVKYGVRVPKLSEGSSFCIDFLIVHTVRDLKNALAKMIQKNPKQLLLCDIYTNRCYPILDWKYLFDIRKTDTIFAYFSFHSLLIYKL